MGSIKSNEMAQSDVVRIEADIRNLRAEIKTSNLTNIFRTEIEGKLSACEEEFKAVISGKASFQGMEKKLQELDRKFADAVIDHALNEIPKGERAEVSRLALEAVKQQLKEGKIKPIRARHEVKEIIRHAI